MIIARSEFAYQSHPHIAIAPDGTWLIVFNNTMRGEHILHPPHDPRYRNMLTRSFDRGQSWTPVEVVPGYEWSGVECASLTPLSSGEIMLNQWQFSWVPLGQALSTWNREKFDLPEKFVSELILSGELETGPRIANQARKFAPWARGKGRTVVHFSDDSGASWRDTRQFETAPYSGGYGLRGAIETKNGRLMMPLNDVPDYQRIFIVASDDRGRNWGTPVLVAWSADNLFTEPAVIAIDDRELMTVFRDDRTGHLYSSRSEDAGASWSEAAQTPIKGYPPHHLALPDGGILCTYGHRMPDYSIRGVLSHDGGLSWNIDETISIRGVLPNKDLGYPCTIAAGPGEFFTVYYCQDERGITGIEGTWWRP
ncbi:MAG: sialidase family protein [Dongiaceae bacterium]